LCDTLGFRVATHKKRARVGTTGLESEVYSIRIHGDIRQIPLRVPPLPDSA
jgi:hypothetical protein